MLEVLYVHSRSRDQCSQLKRQPLSERETSITSKLHIAAIVVVVEVVAEVVEVVAQVVVVIRTGNLHTF